jgi:hypothetical protein
MTTQKLERQLEKDEQLYFLHIPKTAGTTLMTILDNHFDTRDICPARLWDEIILIPQDQLARYKFLRGHFDYNVYSLLPKKPVYITMLRDPVDRLISLHAFWGRSTETWISEHPSYETLFRKAVAHNLKDFVCDESEPIRVEVVNGQTRRLALSIRDDISLLSDDELLSLAKQHLDECAAFGLLERFAEAVNLMSYVFGWYPTTKYQRRMVIWGRIQQANLAPDVLDAIVARNQLDFELYHYAEKLFEQRIQQMHQELLFNHYQQQHQKKHPPTDQIYLKFDQAIAGTNWHPPEHNPLHGPFRWSGPEPISQLAFPLKAGRDLDIQFNVIRAALPDILHSLTLYANNQPVPLHSRTLSTGTTLFYGTILREFLSQPPDLTHLEFRLNRTFSPDLDERLLGIAVSWLRIMPHLVVPKPNGRFIGDWLQSELPSSGTILGVGSWGTSHLRGFVTPEHQLHCLDLYPPDTPLPVGTVFHQDNIIGNSLPANYYDGVLLLSVLEYLGLAQYDQPPLPHADQLALAEVTRLLTAGGRAFVLVPVGHSRVSAQSRLYSPADLRRLFSGWEYTVTYWTSKEAGYVQVDESAVENCATPVWARIVASWPHSPEPGVLEVAQ